MYQTQMYEGMLAETVTMSGDGNTLINAYMARPLGAGPFPAMILLHHMPGWDEWYREATRRFAHHGYIALSPNLYYRVGYGTPEDVAVKVRADGGSPDNGVVGDVAGAIAYLRSLPYVNGKIGLFGTCSGGAARLSGCLPDPRRERGCGLLGRQGCDGRERLESQKPGRAHRLHRRSRLPHFGPLWE